MKLNVLLAKTQHAGASFKKTIAEYTQYFKSKQDAFRGVQRTYVPREGHADDPSKRGNQLVVTTVNEKLSWLGEVAKDYIHDLMSVEATNASGTTSVDLILGDTNFGRFSVPELMRLRGLLESGDLEKMYENMPVRSDAEIWIATDNEMYKGRDILEGQVGKGTTRTINKEQYILPDPNINKDVPNGRPYTPVLGQKDTLIELGDYTVQHFSGEISHRKRAEVLARRSLLVGAIKEAIERANETEVVPSDMTSAKLFGYLHNGKF